MEKILTSPLFDIARGIGDSGGMSDQTPVILFDGTCRLCHWCVRFVSARDPEEVFRFAPLDSAAAGQLVAGRQAHRPLDDTILLVQGGSVSDRSGAVLGICRRLCWPWPLLYALIALPRPWRDWLYDQLARRRRQWFGRHETCPLPDQDLEDRFLG